VIVSHRDCESNHKSGLWRTSRIGGLCCHSYAEPRDLVGTGPAAAPCADACD
jgi:hypothetical protein